jgi:hypothetical protein
LDPGYVQAQASCNQPANIFSCLEPVAHFCPTWAALACSDELASKLRLLESKLLHGEQQGGLDKLAKEKEAQIRQQQQELKRHKEQVLWCLLSFRMLLPFLLLLLALGTIATAYRGAAPALLRCMTLSHCFWAGR